MTFGIIGYGRFGKLWAQELSRFGNVLVYDKIDKKISLTNKKIRKASLSQVCRTDVLFLLVPISEIENCCGQIKKHLLPSTVVVDACSVKVHPAKVMKKILSPAQPLVATHPLFGPDSAKKSKGLSGLHIVVCGLRVSKKQLLALTKIFRGLGLKIFMTTPEAHDRQMATSQALVHYIGRGMEGLHLKPQQLYTPDYLSLLRINDMVIHDTIQLFLDMQKYNPYTASVRGKFLSELNLLENAISSEQTDLTALRGSIDQLDREIIKAIARRAKISKRIGALKKEQNITIQDQTREKELGIFHKKISKSNGLDDKEIAKIFSIIINYSKRLQMSR